MLKPRHAADERMRSHARELDDRRSAADDDVIADGAMPGEHDVVGEDDVVADMAVVTDVAVGKEGAVVTDRRRHPAALGAGVHGHAFADQALFSDRQRGRLALELQILRLMADGGEGEDLRARADCCPPCHRHVADEFDAVAQLHIRSYRAERTDFHVRSQARFGRDDGGGVNFRF